MPSLSRRRLRLACNVFSFDAPQDYILRRPVKLWASNDLAAEIGAFAGEPATGTLVDSVANWASLTLELLTPGANNTAPDPATAVVKLSKTVTAFAVPAWADWAAATAQHATITATADEMNLPKGNYWLVISLETNDAPARTITLLAGLVEIVEDGFNSAGTAPTVDNSAYTKEQSDARYVREFLVPLNFHGELTDEQAFGYFKARSACRVLGMQIAAQVAPVGAAVTVDLLNGSATEQTKIATLADGATYQETLYGAALTLAAGDVIRAKVKSTGIATKGEWLTCNLIVAPTTDA